jgi:hypothetical protein
LNLSSFFQKHKIDPSECKFRTISTVSDQITASKDPFNTSNRIISDLGLKPLTNLVDSRIMALALVEYAIDNKTNFVIDQAEVAAKAKLTKIVADMPFLYNVKENFRMEAVTVNGQVGYKQVKRGRPSNADKKEKALAIFQANKEKKPSDIAKLIQVEIGITFANAYYYVSRVFSKNV